MPKRTLYILTTVLVLLIVGGLLGFYFIYLGGSEPTTDTTQTSTDRADNDRGSGFGNTAGNNQQPSQIDISSTTTPTLDGAVPRLRKIYAGPTAGGISFERSRNEVVNGKTVKITETIIRYIERTKGSVYETKTTDLNTERVSATLIPKIKEAFWNRDGNSLYIRYIPDGSENIETYYGVIKPIKKTATSSLEIPSDINYAPQEIRGSFMARNIQEIVPSSTKDSVFYLRLNNDKEQGILARSDDTRRVEVFGSEITEWLATFIKDPQIALTTKASAAAPGFLYFLNTDTLRFDRILGNIMGLTTLVSPDLSSVLYSESDGGGRVTTNLHNIKTGVAEPFALTTLPEKCVWSKRNLNLVYCAEPIFFPSTSYPDAWYQGTVSFADEIWSINLKTGETALLADPEKIVNEKIDLTRPFLSPKEDYLLFINKKDGSFWSLAL